MVRTRGIFFELQDDRVSGTSKIVMRVGTEYLPTGIEAISREEALQTLVHRLSGTTLEPDLVAAVAKR